MMKKDRFVICMFNCHCFSMFFENKTETGIHEESTSIQRKNTFVSRQLFYLYKIIVCNTTLLLDLAGLNTIEIVCNVITIF